MAFLVPNALEFLRSSYKKDRLAHAYLISGHSEARELVDLFLKEIPVSSDWKISPESKSRKITVASIREFEKFFQMTTFKDGFKVGIIEDCDCMGIETSNAFLKTLEEPPKNSIFFLLTPKPFLILPTILSRCLIIQLKRSGKFLEKYRENLKVKNILKLITGEWEEGRVSGNYSLTSLRVSSLILSLFKDEKEKILEGQKELLKEEKEKFKDSSNQPWLKKREVYFLGSVEPKYVEKRYEILDFFADYFYKKIVRIVDELSCEVTGNIDYKASLACVVGFQKMKKNLEDNLFESLCIETCCLNIFKNISKSM